MVQGEAQGAGGHCRVAEAGEGDLRGAQAVAGELLAEGVQDAVQARCPAADDDQFRVEGEDEGRHVVDQALDEAVDGRAGPPVALAGLREDRGDRLLVERMQGFVRGGEQGLRA